MRKYLLIIITLLSVFVIPECGKKGEAIAESRYGTYRFRTYTADTFQFRILLNGKILTDSLFSPIGLFSREISFSDIQRRLQIIDLKHNDQLVLDTIINMQTGISAYSLVQFTKGQKPFIPPVPNEPAPAAGKFKVRFQYLPYPGDNTTAPKPFFYDSVRCIVRENGVPVDTVILGRYGVTPFYEAVQGNSFTIRLENPLNNSLIDATTSPSIGSGLAGFNTASVAGISNTDFRASTIY